MKFFYINPWTLGTLFFFSKCDRVLGFTLDLFNDANSNSTEIGSPPLFTYGYDGQQAELNGANAFGQSFIPSTDTDTGLIDAIGGARTLGVSENPTVGRGRGGSPINLAVDPDNGQASFNVGSGTNGSASILWDNLGEPEENLTLDGQNHFVIGIQEIDIIDGVTLNFEVTDEFGNSGVISNEVDTLGNSYFPYESIVQDPQNTADLSFQNARAIEFYTSNEPDALDFTFDFVETSDVPFEFSPTVGLILGGILLGFKLIKRRKKLVLGNPAEKTSQTSEQG